MKRLTLILLLFLIPALALAQGAGTNYAKQGGAEWVVGGSLDIVSGGVWKIAGTTITASAADLNSCDYTLVVAKTYAGQQTIEATGAGNDITLTAADDLRFLPTDALTVLSGGSSSVTTTAGDINLIAGGTTQDISLQSVDDITLTASNDANITTTAGNIGITAGGTTQDITLTSVDDILFNATDAVEIGSGGNLSLATAEHPIVLDVVGMVGVLAEVTVTENAVALTGALKLPSGTAPPVACAAGTKATIYYDTDLNELCICNATNWLEIKDMTTGCS